MERGAIRTAAAADADSIQAIYAQIVLETAISFEEVPPDRAEIERRMAAIQETYPYLVFEADGQVLGYAYGGVHRARPAYRWSVETTIYVHKDARGRGVGRALYGRLMELLTAQGFHTAFAGTALPNPGSVALHQAVGFQTIGVFPEIGFKFGRWHDVRWWRRLLAQAPDGDPIPFPRLGES